MPGISKFQASKLRRLIKSYTDACVANSWKGSVIDQNKVAIENNKKLAEVTLKRFIYKLQTKPKE